MHKKTVCKRIHIAIVAAILFLSLSNVSAKESILYGGGPFYSGAASNLTSIRNSGFTTLVLWTIHVHSDGDLVLNDVKLIDDGVYVGKSSWPDEVLAFKSRSTSVRRIEIAIGSWGVPDFETMESFINAEGTGPGSTLYENFKALREAIPAIDAISYDDESNYDIDSTVALSFMLNDLGYKITLCPYTYGYFWGQLFSRVQSERPGIIDRIDLQCYAGGAGNDPRSWKSYFGNLHVAPGLWCYPTGQTPGQIAEQLSSWNNSYNISGGFIWLYDEIISSPYTISQYASAINESLSIDPSDNIILRLHQDCDYGGWRADFDLGDYTTNDIWRAGGNVPDASSLTILPGYKVTFYDGDYLTGESLVKTTDTACLVDDGWNDRIASMSVEVNPTMLGYWKFNSAGGMVVPDTSGYGHDGELVNMTEDSWTDGILYGGLNLDGVDDSVRIAGFKGVAGPVGRTCQAWIKTSQPSGIIMAWGSVNYGGKWIVRVDEGGALRAEVQGGYVIGTKLINDGKWHHIAVVLPDDGTPDISEALLYVDGRLDESGAVSPEPVNTSPEQDVHIGWFSLKNERHFEGTIDEVKIYNYPLSASEIITTYSENALIADVEQDGDVDLVDFAAISGAWQKTDCLIDLTGDCVIDLDDLAVFMAEWLMD
ncbi:MAG: LamG domain-containing protein [Phycisphaerae bacterium]